MPLALNGEPAVPLNNPPAHRPRPQGYGGGGSDGNQGAGGGGGYSGGGGSCCNGGGGGSYVKIPSTGAKAPFGKNGKATAANREHGKFVLTFKK